MGVFGVLSFFAGVVALGFLVVRRGRRLPPTWQDHLMIFVGVAGVITGLAVIFMRFS